MTNNPGEGTPKNPAGEPTPPTAEEVEALKKEVDDLKHKAEVSSQNFERAKKAEAKVKELEAQLQIHTPSNGYADWSEEGKELRKELDSLKSSLQSMVEGQGLSSVQTKHPVLKEKAQEFDEYRQAYPGLPIDKAATLFLAEKGLMPQDNPPPRKGMEKPSGGHDAPPPATNSVEDIKRLREINPRKYIEMIRSGQIKSENLQS